MTQITDIIEPKIESAIKQYLAEDCNQKPWFAFSDFEVVDIMTYADHCNGRNAHYQVLIKHEKVEERCTHTNFEVCIHEHGIDVMYNGQAFEDEDGQIRNDSIAFGSWTKEKADRWLGAINAVKSFRGAEQ